MAKTVPRKRRGRIRTDAVVRQLSQELRRELPPAKPVTTASIRRLLLLWRRLGRRSDLTIAARVALRKRYVKELERVLKAESYDPKDFGVDNVNQLADALVATTERVGRGKSLARLARMRGSVAGELLEQLVRHMEQLGKDFRMIAKHQVEVLNSPKTPLIDARGAKVSRAALGGEFGEPVEAYDFTIRGRKFFDRGEVSFVWPKGAAEPSFVSVCVETEIRMPVKAKQGGKQIGRAQARYDFLKRYPKGTKLKFYVRGRRKPIEVEPKEIIFAQNSIMRTLVTLSRTEKYRPSYTRRGGYLEHFWHLDVDLRAKVIWQLVNIVTGPRR
jgi:hypothetical protein